MCFGQNYLMFYVVYNSKILFQNINLIRTHDTPTYGGEGRNFRKSCAPKFLW